MDTLSLVPTHLGTGNLYISCQTNLALRPQQLQLGSLAGHRLAVPGTSVPRDPLNRGVRACTGFFENLLHGTVPFSASLYLLGLGIPCVSCRCGLTEFCFGGRRGIPIVPPEHGVNTSLPHCGSLCIVLGRGKSGSFVLVRTWLKKSCEKPWLRLGLFCMASSSIRALIGSLCKSGPVALVRQMALKPQLDFQLLSFLPGSDSEDFSVTCLVLLRLSPSGLGYKERGVQRGSVLSASFLADLSLD